MAMYTVCGMRNEACKLKSVSNELRNGVKPIFTLWTVSATQAASCEFSLHRLYSLVCALLCSVLLCCSNFSLDSCIPAAAIFYSD